MRDDLLDAQACIDWAIAQLDIFSRRIACWIDSRPYIVAAAENSQADEEIWEVREFEPIPRIINAEAGAIVNSLRSSLDLLANRLAERNGHIEKKMFIFRFVSRLPSFKAEDAKR